MPKIIKRPPTAKEMKSFSKEFTKTEWRVCCEDQEFLDAVSENLGRAHDRADFILNGVTKLQEAE